MQYVFCETACSRKAVNSFVSTVLKMETALEINKKTVSINQGMNIQQEGLVLLDYKILGIAE